MTNQPTSLSDDDRWRAVMQRDARFDRVFVYAVRSTRVFCRPSCPSRRAGREQVVFFSDPAAALAAGFRPCRRCRPDAPGDVDARVERIGQVCRAIEERDEGVPTLAELAETAGMSANHLQRVFKAVTGVSPRQYADAVRLDRLKQSLRAGEPVASALYGAGYGSSSRLYEKAPSALGMTPASYARGGRGAEITFALADCPADGSLGRLLLAATERGICMVALGDDDDGLASILRAHYPAAEIRRDDAALATWVSAVLALVEGEGPHADLPLDIRVSAFQAQVYARLLAIPRGETRSYQQIAAEIGKPKAARAVGRACASNPVSLIVPCHRVVAADGSLHGYGWGLARKQALLERERGV